GTDTCAAQASCTNTETGYDCDCNTGFWGDGETCTDVNECDAQPCDANASCSNSQGSFSCACNLGFEGDGATCSPAVDEPDSMQLGLPESFLEACNTVADGDSNQDGIDGHLQRALLVDGATGVD